MNYREKYKEWCESSYYDESTKKELYEIRAREKEIKDRFCKELDFGTGGLRGIIGAGTNRMNIYTVRKATQGLANYILSEKMQGKGVVIAYDSRNMSPEFADEAALCLGANGIKTYVFESLRPTPELSFAVRELRCAAGIVITASHNPPEYNGYKVYWEDGAQITFPKDKEIIHQVEMITDMGMIKTICKKEALKRRMYISIGKEIDEKYIQALKRLSMRPAAVLQAAKELRIVYTPLHGSGAVPVQKGLKEFGFEQVYIVKEQERPDGNFPTIEYPNPEDPKAFTLAITLAKEVDADIILATDPDADRLGVYVKDSKTSEYISFTGNMSGVLIAEYILKSKKELGALPDHGALVRTIVTTKMADAVAQDYQVDLIEVLTGFKYIGEQIKLLERNGKPEYLFGFEESYGCLTGTYARDKDAVGAVMMLCEAAAFYKTRKHTLWDEMLVLYEKYGYFREGLYTITLKGQEGNEKIKAIMKTFRISEPKFFGDLKVLKICDYKSGEIKDLRTGEKFPTGLPRSDVMYYKLANDSWCCVRSSGTEPKIKFYMGVKGTNLEDSDRKLRELTKAVIEAAKSE